ncbi:MAG TPA: hypothetical protein VIS48_06765 [Candidatus Kryptonia bacterium]
MKGVNNPTKFTLEHNHPNPFNPTTKKNYQLPASSHFMLIVYDALGRGVKTLVDEQKSA